MVLPNPLLLSPLLLFLLVPLQNLLLHGQMHLLQSPLILFLIFELQLPLLFLPRQVFQKLGFLLLQFLFRTIHFLIQVLNLFLDVPFFFFLLNPPLLLLKPMHFLQFHSSVIHSLDPALLIRLAPHRPLNNRSQKLFLPRLLFHHMLLLPFLYYLRMVLPFHFDLVSHLFIPFLRSLKLCF